MVTVLGCKPLTIESSWLKPRWGQFSDQFSDLGPESKTGLWKCWGGNLVPPLQFAALFFFHVHGKTVHFLNIQEVLIGITTFLKPGPESGRGHPEK